MTSIYLFANKTNLFLTFNYEKSYKTEPRLLVYFSEFVTYVIIKNDNRPFDSLVSYYLSRNYFYAYVFLQLSLDSI